ncbi:pentatricopeptide repeat-containing protein At2g01390 [Selaginella moellendorffii]|uniref:pentatricopeptide repeat-containing protein At2g01390 n=1 Tax=Selaginella moellendorffii TaxID=88036 RepID=UPI000D1CE58D|nr:pentatricopeptide repeat-containing protein At2g01390 [Selaginella moellendorffii]XP_024538380.1 pentatricopeptide repeat-containing protein At2g01390 [Selaginella moellendorffii]|eukprot:XP_024538377.1 pentatricopeptide repeat-containing protein At2g01390 [Selaginella moellendorffii]
MRPSWRRARWHRYCEFHSSAAVAAAPSTTAKNGKGSHYGSFFQFLRQHPQVGGLAPADRNGNGAVEEPSTSESPAEEETPLNIQAGNLHMYRPCRPPRWEPFKSRDTIGSFFSKMEAAIEVGNVLREMGWNEDSQVKVEKLKVPWNPLVVLQVLRQPLEPDAAWGFFQWLKGVEGYRHTEHTYNSLIEVFGRVKDVTGIQKVLDDMSAYGCGMNVVLFTTVIHWYSRADDIDRAVEMWNQMLKVGCLPNVVTYTMLMSLLTKLKRFRQVGEIFKDMVSGGCRPNVRTYTVLIQCLASSGNLDAALLVFEKLDSLKASPTAATFRVLMDSAASAGDLELLKGLFEGMKKANQKPNGKMYFTVMDALKKAGKLTEAAPLLEAMESMIEADQLYADFQAKTPDQESTKEEDDRRGSSGGETKERSVPLQDMEVMEGLDRPLVDMKAFSTIIYRWTPETAAALEAANFRWDPWKVLRVLMGMRDVTAALRFFYWVEKQPGYKHDSFVYTKMISLLGRHHHFSQVEELLMKLQSSDIEVSIVTMNSIIFTLSVSHNPDLAMKIFYWMKDLKVKPNTRTYTTVIDMLVKMRHFDRAMAIYQEMLDAGCKPDAHTYTVLIQSLGREGKIDAAEHLLEKMPLNGCKPNVVNYTSLINSLIHYGRVSHALAVFKRMQDEGVMPNSITYSLMSKGLKRANMLHDLVEVEKKMATIDFWKQQRVKSEDETLVNETILKALLPELKRESQDQRQTE